MSTKQKLMLKHVGRGNYLPLTVGESYEFVKAEEGMFWPDIYICVLCGDRKVWAHYWRFDITAEKAYALIGN